LAAGFPAAYFCIPTFLYPIFLTALRLKNIFKILKTTKVFPEFSDKYYEK